MKNGNWAGFWLLSTVLLAGCKGFWDLPASTGTNGTTPTTLSSGIFYVLNQDTKQIVGYSINSGKLNAISGATQTLAATPFCIAIAPSGGFLYVGTVNGIYLFDVGSGGTLTLANSGAPISSDIPSGMQISGSWLVDAFVNGSSQVQLDALPISSSTGLYTGSGGTPPYQTFNISNAAVTQMILSPDGTNLFVALGAAGTIVVPFSLGNANPIGTTETTVPLANSNSRALSVAVDPQNRLFYIGETNTNSTANPSGLFVYDYSSLGSGTPRTSPTQISGSPIASGGIAPNAILPIATGQYVYVANGEGNSAAGNIAWFSISASGTSYSVTAGSTIASGIQPISLAEDSDDNFVLAVSTGGSTSSGNYDLEAYTMSSGALTTAIKSTTGNDPVGAWAVAALPK